jgi:hypothetical protein
MKIKSPLSATIVAGGILAIGPLGGTASAATDTVYKYATPKTGYYSISAKAMTPDGDTSAASYFISSGVGVTTQNNGACFGTGVNLPQGAKATVVTVFYSSGATSNISAKLNRKSFTDGNVDTIASKTFTDNTQARKMGNLPITASLAGIDNLHFSYSLDICLGKNDGFESARIAYTYTNAGD